MFFIFSKIIWAVLVPLNALWVMFAAAIGLCVRRPLAGHKILIFTCLLFLFLGVFPVGHNLMVLLERQYPLATPAALPANIDGIIVLGGSFNSKITERTGQLTANSNITRMIEFITLMQKYPRAKHVFSGGSGQLLAGRRREADDAYDFLKLSGQNPDLIIYERESRNTYENVSFSKALLKPKHGETWVVVTSAFHMPRTMAVFSQQDWEVIPYSAGVKTDLNYKILPNSFNVLHEFGLLSKAVKEFVGAVTYYISGKSAYPFPFNPEPET